MSDFHILGLSPKQDRARVAFHIPVADANNAVGYSYRDAIAEYEANQTEAGVITSAIPGLDAAAHGLTTGAVIERVETISFDGNLTNAAKLAEIQAAYTAREAALLQTAQKVLEFWSYAADVA